MMHDAGGNRSETVAALPLLIAALKARGFSFVRVSDLAGLPVSAVEVPASMGQKLRGQAFDIMLEMDDVVDFGSYEIGIKTIGKYGITF